MITQNGARLNHYYENEFQLLKLIAPILPVYKYHEALTPADLLMSCLTSFQAVIKPTKLENSS